MAFFSRIAEALLIVAILYAGIVLLSLQGIAFGELIFTDIGFIGVVNLALCYTFYFRL